MRPLKHMLAAIGDRLSSQNPGLVGASLALLLALLWVTFGFFRMLFVVAATLGGYYIGIRWFSDRERIKTLLDRIFPPGLFR